MVVVSAMKTRGIMPPTPRVTPSELLLWDSYTSYWDLIRQGIFSMLDNHQTSCRWAIILVGVTLKG